MPDQPAPPDPPPPTPPCIGPVELVADLAAEGKRADRFLADAIGSVSRSRVKSLIVEGHVTRNGVVLAEPAEAVRAGARYVLRIPAPSPPVPAAQAIPFTVLYEDADLIVLDKPPGLVVHPAPGNADGTLVNALLAHCGESLAGIGGERRPGIVHRLDKDTSGVMVAAKNEMAMQALAAAFAARDLDRAYLALCWGLPVPASGAIEGAIGRDPRERKRMAVVTRGGKAALTHYQSLRSWEAAVAMLECRLATGRTHQIRVHLAKAGHPLIGDPLYLRRIPAAARGLPDPLRRALLGFPRQALHAFRLGFRHPRTGQTLSFETPPPADLAAIVSLLDKQAGRASGPQRDGNP